MKKWIFSSFIYLLIVIGGYWAYTFFAADDNTANHHGEHQNQTDEETENHAHVEEGHDGGHGEHEGASSSEVMTHVELMDDAITVTLKDQEGNPVEDLEVSHEKLMHLILISEDLESFTHLHPEKTAPGTFFVQADLKDGMYQAFVDIKPANLDYVVEPQQLMAGEHAQHEEEHVHLEPDKEWTKVQGQMKATLNAENLSVNGDAVLSFQVEGGELQPYLGALGHVVVVNEQLDEFIHVHPASEEDPIFEAHFTKPGMYKLWGEFKLDGEVYAFPYVIEITE